MKFKAKKTRKVLINITSLIDVLFLLLIFFMVSSTFIEKPGMDLELPESESSTLQEVKDLVLQVKPDGSMVLNNQDVSEVNLKMYLEEAHGSNPDAALILKADKEAKHGQVVTIMDIAKQVGIGKLIIATKEKGSDIIR
ncbi:ExbD/TolR family protein [candidate division KSB1 bacterium]